MLRVVFDGSQSKFEQNKNKYQKRWAAKSHITTQMHAIPISNCQFGSRGTMEIWTMNILMGSSNKDITFMFTARKYCTLHLRRISIISRRTKISRIWKTHSNSMQLKIFKPVGAFSVSRCNITNATGRVRLRFSNCFALNKRKPHATRNYARNRWVM